MEDRRRTDRRSTPLPGVQGELTAECAAFEAPEPCSIVIFGASGDLAGRKLIPSLFRLHAYGLLPEKFFLVGASRTPFSDDAFRDQMAAALKSDPAFDPRVWAGFAKKIFYSRVEYSDASTYAELKERILELDARFSTNGNCLVYLAMPPSAYSPVVTAIGSIGLSGSLRGWTRLIVEKPYGRDLASARELSSVIYARFAETNVYRIDHYLGKDTVQNIMMLRFANSIFEPIWNRRYVDHIQITVAETLGVEKRAGFYEQAGVVRDMFQNHILQVLSIVAMEPPSFYESSLVADERVKVLRSLRPLAEGGLSDAVVMGQYGQGPEKTLKAYAEEPGVSPGSRTPTFAAMRIFIENWRWQGVPIYLRSGKRMRSRFSQVTIQFKGVPHHMFRETLYTEIGPNALILRLQPDERVQLKFHTKSPGSRMCLRDVVMDFPYLEGYGGRALDAYERVLLDAMNGDKMLFVRSDSMELSWDFLAPVLEACENGGLNPCAYQSSSWGPAEADELIAKDGRHWINHAIR